MAWTPARIAPAGARSTLQGVGASAMTRRRALELGAATGLLSVLAPSAAARSRAAARGFTLPVERFRGRSGVLRAPRRFDLLGVRGNLDGVALEVRVRTRRGRWSPWVALGHGHAHRPDTGKGHRASDPVWAGGADELDCVARRAATSSCTSSR